MRARAGTAAAALVAAALSLALAGRAVAQAGGGAGGGGGGADVIRLGLARGGARPPAAFYRMLGRHPDAFTFRHGWLARARRVRETRAALRARGAWSTLNAPAALARVAAPGLAGGAALGGTLRYPTLIPLFSNTTATDSAVMDPAAVAAEFWGSGAPPPYSVTTYYREVSGGLLTVTGSVIPPIRVSRPDTFYSGGAACEGLCSPLDGNRVPDLIVELLRHADSTVNFAAFADSTTDTVPAIVILDPQVGAECYLLYPPAASSIWSHRFSLSGWGVGPFVTNDSINGRPVIVDDYIIQGGEGGRTGCAPGALAPIGTVTHETGHLFGLPDLYDTGGQTEGLGRWDLMSEGNELAPYRPAHMSAWSLATLGWITEVPLTSGQTVVAAPVETGRTAYVIPLAGTAGREFFLLENRQPIGSDSMMYGPGLMIYHLDTLLMDQRLATNTVNAIWPHALAVEEASGDTGLDCVYPAACNDRGDAGDPFPGASGNTRFGAATRPAANGNAGRFGGVVVDSIRQVAPFGAVSFRVRFGGATVVAASDTDAGVVVDGTRVPVFRDLLSTGSTHTIGIDSVQLSADGRTQFAFASWSDGGARTHPIVGDSAGASYVAAVAPRYLVKVVRRGGGTVVASLPLDSLTGSFLAAGADETLTAVPGAGEAFVGWTADTVAGAPVLALQVTHPYTVTATFAGTAEVVRQLLTGHSALDNGQLLVLDYLGNNNRRFDLGDFVAWLDRNPGTLVAAARGAAAAGKR